MISRAAFALIPALLAAFSLTVGAQGWTPGTNALRFDGVNDYVTFGPAPGLGASNFTIECWFRREAGGATASTGTGGLSAIPLVSKGRSEADGDTRDMNWFLGITGSSNVLAADFEEFTGGTNHPVTGVTSIASNTWYHGAVAYNGTNWFLYLNGALQRSNFVGRAPRFDSIQHAALGSALDSSGTAAGFFKGTLDEVRVWNYARTAPDISNSMNLEIVSAPGLVGRWGLNEAMGTNAFDSSGSNVTGALINGPLWIPATNFPPDAPVLVSPASNAVNVLQAPTLTVIVSDTNSDNLTVVFYGRLTPTNGNPPFTVIGTNTVASGSTTGRKWLGLAPATSYDWYVTVSESTNTTTGPVWSFTTGYTLVASNSVWKYRDNGSNQGTNWIAPGFNDNGWSNGPAQLGYGDGDEATVVSYGTNANNKYITTYFRRAFTVTNASVFGSATLKLIRDDGAVVYLNGAEVYRNNLPDGAVDYLTQACISIGGAAEGEYLTSIVSPSLLVNGTNVLAVEIHQETPTSSDISFDLELVGNLPVTNASVVRGPYLQVGTPTSVIVRWRTDAPIDSRVRFGTNLASLTNLADNAAVVTEHEIPLSGLQPGTKYFYSIGTAAATLAGGDTNHYFITSPLPGTPKPTRVWVIGDAGRANANQAAVRDAYYNFTGTNHTDLWLQLGDNAYDTGTDTEFQAAVFDMYSALLRKSVTWPALGNHETAQSHVYCEVYSYFDMFTLPKNGEAGGEPSGTEHYYSFDYANIHFVCLDSMTASRATNGAMANWLRTDLANNTNTWLIAYWHHPPYTKGSHDSDDASGDFELVEMRENFLPILESYGVDLVLSGHSHDYERSFLIDGHYDFSSTFVGAMKINGGDGREDGNGAYSKPAGPSGHQGAVYAVVGSSGQTSGGPLNHPAMFISLNNLGSMVIDVNSNRLDAKFLRETGATNDHFTLLKFSTTNIPPVANDTTYIIPADSATNLVLTGSDPNGDPFTFVTNTPPQHGLLSAWNPATGHVTYTPAHGFSGSESFTFRVADGAANSGPGTVSITVQPLADANTNGIPDAWEAQYGVSVASADPDGDGLNNLAEYLAGTNPANAVSTLAPVVTRNGSGFYLLTWNSIGGVRYRVKFGNGDTNGNYNGVYSDLIRSIALEMNSAPVGAASTQTFTDNFALTGGQPPNGRRYYRIEVVR